MIRIKSEDFALGWMVLFVNPHSFSSHQSIYTITHETQSTRITQTTVTMGKPSVLVVLTSAGQMTDGKPTGWYLVSSPAQLLFI